MFAFKPFSRKQLKLALVETRISQIDKDVVMLTGRYVRARPSQCCAAF